MSADYLRRVQDRYWGENQRVVPRVGQLFSEEKISKSISGSMDGSSTNAVLLVDGEMVGSSAAHRHLFHSI